MCNYGVRLTCSIMAARFTPGTEMRATSRLPRRSRATTSASCVVLLGVLVDAFEALASRGDSSPALLRGLAADARLPLLLRRALRGLPDPEAAVDDDSLAMSASSLSSFERSLVLGTSAGESLGMYRRGGGPVRRMASKRGKARRDKARVRQGGAEVVD